MPWPGDGGAPFGKIPMVMSVLHEVGLVGFGELSQPDSITASAMHAEIRINIRNLPLLEERPTKCTLRTSQLHLQDWLPRAGHLRYCAPVSTSLPPRPWSSCR